MHLVLFCFWVILSWKYHATWIHCCTARAEDATSQQRQNKPADQGGNIFKVELIHIFVFVQMVLFSIRSDLGANLVAGVNAFLCHFRSLHPLCWWGEKGDGSYLLKPSLPFPILDRCPAAPFQDRSVEEANRRRAQGEEAAGPCYSPARFLSSSCKAGTCHPGALSHPAGTQTWKGALEVCQPVRFPILGKILSLLPVAGCPLQCGRATAILAACCHRTTQQAKGTKSRGKKVSIHPHPLSGGVPDWALCLERALSAS